MAVPLRGVAIGNGWIDPRRQYPTYIDFAVKVGLLEENSDVRLNLRIHLPELHIFLQAWKEARKVTDICVAELDKNKDKEMMSVKGCERLVMDIVKDKNKK